MKFASIPTRSRCSSYWSGAGSIDGWQCQDGWFGILYVAGPMADVASAQKRLERPPHTNGRVRVPSFSYSHTGRNW
jgi:hypothetical protein